MINNKLHSSLSLLINHIDNEAVKLLEEHDFLKNLIIRETNYGSSSIKLRDNNVTSYSIDYTFFCDLEGFYGERENDVSLGVVLHYNHQNIELITRDIVSKYGDIEYPQWKNSNLSSFDVDKCFLNMRNDFLKVLKCYIDHNIKDQQSKGSID